jgi:8-oxo-dGTP diphosphatase
MTNTKLPSGYDAAIFEKPSVTVDLLVFTIKDNELQVVLVKRGVDPFKDSWALPGGFVKIDESVETAAKRELAEETGLNDVYLEQLYTFGEIDRDPRTRVITVSYFALTPYHLIQLEASTDVTEVQLFPVRKLPELAFDHREIIQTGIERLRNKIQYSTIVYGLMPEQFRLSQLQKVYEVILGQEIDKRNFRKKMSSLDLLEDTGKMELEGAHRPAKLYKFKKKDVVFFD